MKRLNNAQEAPNVYKKDHLLYDKAQSAIKKIPYEAIQTEKIKLTQFMINLIFKINLFCSNLLLKMFKNFAQLLLVTDFSF